MAAKKINKVCLTPHLDPEYRESFEKLSTAVARRREAGQSTDLFMGPMAIIEPSDEWHPRGVYDTFGAEQPTQARMTRQTPIARDRARPHRIYHSRRLFRPHQFLNPKRRHNSDKTTQTTRYKRPITETASTISLSQ